VVHKIEDVQVVRWWQTRWALAIAIGLAFYAFSFGPLVYLDAKADLGFVNSDLAPVLFFPHFLAAYAIRPYHSYIKWCAEAGGATRVHDYETYQGNFDREIR